MRKYLFILLSALVLIAYSCKSANKTDKSNAAQTSAQNGKTFSVQKGQTTINWTAYKKSNKAPVHGTFKSSASNTASLVKKATPATTALGAVNGLEFNVPVMDIFSGNEQRDNILRKFFFGIMKNTVQLQGTVHLDSTAASTGRVDFSMNDEEHSFPVTFSVKDDTVSLMGSMDMNDWHIISAMKSLNDHCKLQHTGADGVSKTWSVVDLNVSTVLSVK